MEFRQRQFFDRMAWKVRCGETLDFIDIDVFKIHSTRRWKRGLDKAVN